MTPQLLSRLYALGDCSPLIPLSPGTESRIWRFASGRGDYLLRTLPSREQGDLQYRISRHLARQGFCWTPTILPAADGSPCVLWEGTWYHVQTFLPGRRPGAATPSLAARTAQLTLHLHRALAEVPTPDGPRPFIHGDLGPWNLLSSGGRLWVVDFSAARPGEPYYDLASLLAGLLNHGEDALRPRLLSAFLAAMEESAPCDLPLLSAQLRRWSEDTLARWGVESPYVRRTQATLSWLASDPLLFPYIL